MPKWIPGKQGGKPVSVYYNLPIIFRLSSGDSSQTSSDTTIFKDLMELKNIQNVIIEIDGKIVSNEEWEKFDTSTIKTMSLEGNNPKRIKIETKKE